MLRSLIYRAHRSTEFEVPIRIQVRVGACWNVSSSSTSIDGNDASDGLSNIFSVLLASVRGVSKRMVMLLDDEGDSRCHIWMLMSGGVEACRGFIGKMK